MTFYEKSLNVIELPAVLNVLSQEAVSDLAKEKCLKIEPTDNPSEVKRLIDETTAACQMMVLKGSPSFSGIKDVKSSLERAKLGGGLNTRELLDICTVLKAARLVKGYIADDKLSKSCIDFLFNSLRTNKFLEDTISTSIIAVDEIADCASPDLGDIRRKMRVASSKARDALQKIISSPGYSRALQENIITMRSDRYVVPVKAEHKGDIPGLVHDISATGATLFIEPMAAVKANNELRELAAKEKLEIERILLELSMQCAEHSIDIESDYEMLVRLDVIFAKAKLSYKYECSPAVSSEKDIKLIRARHPLLSRDTVVPVDVEMDHEFNTMVITGPNTGGKTVLLKTIGLLAAMNQCGLHIPAASESCIPIYSRILADIGDEQSIEQSLSTFSAHMVNIVSIIDNCDENSLVLFDELGAGTDPTEGAALAVSIIEKVRSRGATVIATTHYTELKIYATNEEGVLNASCEFDVESLKPTYRLLIGIPGKSNAFAISKRLGLSDDIIEDAKSRISKDSEAFEATIAKLEKTQNLLDRQKDEVLQKLKEAEEKAKKASMLKAEQEVRLEKAEIKAKRRAEEILEEARKTAEDVYSELDEMKKRINEEQSANEINEARNELRRRLNLAEDHLNSGVKEADNRVSSRKIVPSDYVEIKSMGLKGQVVSIGSDSLCTVRCGNMNVSSKEDNLFLLEDYSPSKKNVSVSQHTVLHNEAMKSEIDIRGMDAVEGVMTAENFIDNAAMNKLETVNIIHGKGTGVLRNAVHKMLKNNKLVKSYRLGTFGEGESGVTIVNLK